MCECVYVLTEFCQKRWCSIRHFRSIRVWIGPSSFSFFFFVFGSALRMELLVVMTVLVLNCYDGCMDIWIYEYMDGWIDRPRLTIIHTIEPTQRRRTTANNNNNHSEFSKNRYKYFRWTPRNAWFTLLYAALIPVSLGVVAYKTDVCAGFSCVYYLVVGVVFWWGLLLTLVCLGQVRVSGEAEGGYDCWVLAC